jgi:hypothetical protein
MWQGWMRYQLGLLYLVGVVRIDKRWVWVIDIARVLDFLGRWTLVRFFAELVVLSSFVHSHMSNFVLRAFWI